MHEHDPPVAGKPKEKLLTPFGRIIAPVLILGLGWLGLQVMAKFASKPTEEIPTPIIPSVEVVEAKYAPAEVLIASQGVLESSIETRSASEVGGKISWVSPKFVAGGKFIKDEELLRMEAVDYEAALAHARATLEQAKMALKVEEARAEQALRDWKKLATGEKPANDLVTRGPQLAAARAASAAAEAALAKAEKDLERTTFKAPYTGRIRRTFVDLGSFVPPGTPIAEFYSTEAFEIRLPISADEFTLLDGSTKPRVSLTSVVGDRTLTYEGTIIRTEGEFERHSRSIYGVAEIQPTNAPDPLLAPGLFFKATISGKKLPRVVRLPRQCLYTESSVLVVNAKNEIHSAPVKIDRNQLGEVFISEGLNDGDRICATALPFVNEGMLVAPMTPGKKDPVTETAGSEGKVSSSAPRRE